MNIQHAINAIEGNGYGRRLSWPNNDYIYKFGEVIMYYSLGIDSVWVPSHLDLLALDWMEVFAPER
jgi:hypothetical protein